MSVLLEEPIPIALFGIVLVLLALVGLLKTGLMRFLYIAGGVAALTAVLLLVESSVVTPKEEIENVLQVIARDLETNDQQLILAHISVGSASLKERASRALKPILIDRVAVKQNLTVEFDANNPPRSAKASFNAVVVGSEKSGVIRNQTSPFFFIVDFVKEGDDWRVADYVRKLPNEGWKRKQ